MTTRCCGSDAFGISLLEGFGKVGRWVEKNAVKRN